MKKGIGSIYLAFGLLTLAMACGSSEDSEGEPKGGAGTAGTSTAGTSAAGTSSAAGSSTAGSGSGGKHAGGGATAGGNSTSGGGGHAGSGGKAALGGAGGGQAAAGSANGGGPPSTAGLPFVGSCLDATHCTDEWDETFGADTLAQICTAQKGTWSTNHCDPAAWKKKCTQDVFSGVYVQYLPANGICAAGFEEQL